MIAMVIGACAVLTAQALAQATATGSITLRIPEIREVRIQSMEMTDRATGEAADEVTAEASLTVTANAPWRLLVALMNEPDSLHHGHGSGNEPLAMVKVVEAGHEAISNTVSRYKPLTGNEVAVATGDRCLRAPVVLRFRIVSAENLDSPLSLITYRMDENGTMQSFSGNKP